MKKSKDKDELLSDDLDIFEEIEEEQAEEAAAPLEDAPVEEDEDLVEFNEPESQDDLSEKTLLHDRPEKAPEEESPRNFAEDIAELAPDVPVNLVAVIGKTTINVGELVKYRIGEVIDMGRAPGETVDLVANGRLIARGELVEMEGKLGVRILKLVR